MKKSILSMAVISAIAVSCSNDNVISDSGKAKPIKITTSLDKQTRAYTDAASITSFKMTAIKVNDGSKHIDDVSVTHTGSSCSWLGNTTWPGNGSNLLFFAYAPETLGSGVTTSFDKTAGGKIENFVQNASSTPVDLITAYTEGVNGSGVTLTFKHALSKVELKAQNHSLIYTMKVKGIKLGGIHSKGTLTFAPASPWSNSWGSTSDPKVYSYDGEEKDLNGSSATDLNYGDFLVVPQTLPTAWNPSSPSAGGSYISVLCQIKKGDAKVYPTDGGTEEYGWAAIPVPSSISSWEPGKKYVYTLRFFYDGNGGAGYVDPEETISKTGKNPGVAIVEKTNISITVSIEDWTNGANHDLDY